MFGELFQGLEQFLGFLEATPHLRGGGSHQMMASILVGEFVIL